MKNPIALFVTFYPGIDPFVIEFFDSVMNQTRRDFDLIIVNDGWDSKGLTSQYQDLHIVELSGRSSIAENREIGINYVISHNYEYLVLCDADDTFHPNRVETSIHALQNYDVVVNDVNIISTEGNVLVSDYFSKSLAGNEPLDINFILRKNVFGFSNTSIKLRQMSNCNFPRNLKVIDWYLFTQLIFLGKKARFIPVSLTNYRQHSNNLIGISSFSVEMFRRLALLKKQHFDSLSEWNSFFRPYANGARCLERLTDEEICTLISAKQKENPYPLWWEFIND